MSDRIHPAAIDATGYVGDGAQALHDDGTWKIPVGGGGASPTSGETLMVDGVNPPEPLTTEAGDDWLYQG